MTANERPQAIPVLVVGAGPAGLTTAIGLARQGVGSMLVERHAATSTFPKASGISTRTMEIFRGWGLEGAMREHSQDILPCMSVRPTLTGPQVALLQLGFPSDEEALAVSPTHTALIPQDRLEPILLRHALDLGVEVRFGTELISLEQDVTGVTAVIRSVADGTCSTVRTSYVVGADGTRSTVRDLLGIEAHGPDDLGDYATVLFRADLWSRLGDERFGLYQLNGPVPGVLVPTGRDDRWVLGMPWDPRTESFADYTKVRCIELIRAATGVPDLEVEVIRRMPIEFVAQAADRVRDGSVFLIGDAAHRMPPFGGRGLNTAVADAFGLSWKLAWVLRGWADPTLLDTHAEERNPVGHHNLSLAAARSEGGTRDGLTEDMGYVYRSAAIDVVDGDEPARGHLFPTTATPGARLPHAWLTGPIGSVSTLDLVGPGLTLITGPAGGAWLAAADEVAMSTPFPLSVHCIGMEFDSPDGRFEERFRLGLDGAVLVRPDGHIVWRSEAGTVEDHRAALGAAVAVATGHAGEGAVAVTPVFASSMPPSAA